MECYISKHDSWEWDEDAHRSVIVGQIYKGFPIVSESQRKTAEGWAKTMKAIQIPEELTECGVDGYDDRMNNKIFKVYYMANYAGKKIKLYFDMYVPQMLDLMRHGVIEKEIIKVPLVFIDRSRLVMKDGEFHKEYIEKVEKKRILKETKAISTKDLKFGHCYSKTEDGQKFIYIGPVKGKGHLIIDTGWDDEELRNPSRWHDHIKITKSLGFKFARPEFYKTADDILSYVKLKRDIYNKNISDAEEINKERIAEAKAKAEGGYGWGRGNWQYFYTSYPVPKYEDEFEKLDILENLLNTVDK